jgi:hypothetical protein
MTSIPPVLLVLIATLTMAFALVAYRPRTLDKPVIVFVIVHPGPKTELNVWRYSLYSASKEYDEDHSAVYWMRGDSGVE